MEMQDQTVASLSYAMWLRDQNTKPGASSKLCLGGFHRSGSDPSVGD